MESNTREKLIEIATQLFATKGFAAVSVREVTVAAEINVSAISYYFKGKEGLYQAVLEEQLSPILQALRLTQNQDSLSPIKRLTFYTGQIANIHKQRPFLARFITSEANNPTECGGSVVANHLSQVYQFLQTALREGIAEGDFRADLDVDYTTISLIGIINFYFISRPLIPKIFSFQEHIDTEAEYTSHAINIFLHGIMN